VDFKVFVRIEQNSAESCAGDMQRLSGDIWTVLGSFLNSQEVVWTSLACKTLNDLFAQSLWPRMQRFALNLLDPSVENLLLLDNALRRMPALKSLRLLTGALFYVGFPFRTFTHLHSIELHPLAVPLDALFRDLACCPHLESLTFDGNVREAASTTSSHTLKVCCYRFVLFVFLWSRLSVGLIGGVGMHKC
jgi:hypothetical protein